MTVTIMMVKTTKGMTIMPMPKPKKDESKQDFIDRCMSSETMKSEYPDNDQRLAVCYDLWDRKNSQVNADNIERRCIQAEIRATKDDNKFEGYAAVFNTQAEIIWFREQIKKGAFKNTIKQDDVRALYNHDSNYVLGRNKSGTLRLKEDSKGLLVDIDIPDISYARDLKISVERGDVNQMSFGFNVLKEEWNYEDIDMPLRTLIEVKLFDVSIVTYPAYKETIVGVRSMDYFNKWTEYHKKETTSKTGVLTKYYESYYEKIKQWELSMK